MTIPDLRFRLDRDYDNADWVDKTADVRGTGTSGITIVRGVPEERQVADPATCDFTLENLDGTYTPRNPRSAYVDILGQNVPVRVRTKEGSATTLPSVRATEHTDTGNDETITVTAPAGNAEGDILIVIHAFGSAAQFTPTIAESGGTAWERLVFWEEPEAYTAGGTAPYKNVVVWWKRVTDVAEDATFTLYQAGTYHGRVVAMAIQDAGGFVPSIDWGYTTATAQGGNIQALPVRGMQLYTAVKWGNVTIAQQGADYTTVASIAGAANEPTVCVLSGDEDDDEVWTNPDYRTDVGPGAADHFDNDPFDFTAGINIMAANHPREKYWGEVSAWPQTWTTDGADATVDVNAGGILRRYTKDPERSPIERTAAGLARHLHPGYVYTDKSQVAPSFDPFVAVWPLSQDFRAIGYGVGAEMVDGTIEFGKPLSPGGEGALISTSSVKDALRLEAAWWGQDDPVIAIATRRCVGFTLRFEPDTATGARFRLKSHLFAKQDLRIDVTLAAATFTVVATRINQETAAEVVIATVTVDRRESDDYHRILFEWYDSDTTYRLFVDGVPESTGTWTTIAIGPTRKDVFIWSDVVFGQVQISGASPGTGYRTSIHDLWPAVQGHIGETASERIHRLCREERIGPEVYGEKAYNRNRLGPQPTASLADVLMDAAEADGGILTESSRRLGICYRPRTDLYWANEVELDYTAGTIQPSLEPVEDDQTILNQVTYTGDGTSYSLTETDGARGTTRAGVYAKTGEISTFHRTMLAQRAQWAIYLGTLDESRYRDVTVNIRKINDEYGLTTLAQSLRDLVIGDRLKLTNLPIWMPPGPAHLLIVGITETLTNLDHVITYHTRPGSPYMPGIIGDSTAGAVDVQGQRVDASASTLTSNITDSATSLSVTTDLTSRLAAPWTVNSDDWNAAKNGGGLYIDIGGEKMLVTAIAADASTLAHDASTESTFTTTTPYAFNHTPSGTPAAALVFISHGTPDTDVITGVTYGGVSMTRIGTAADTAGEPGRVYVYALTSGVLSGVQAVSITHTGSATVKHVVAVTATASGTVQVRQVQYRFEDQANPSCDFVGNGATTLHYSILYSGQDALASIANAAGMTDVQDHDFGAFTTTVDVETASSQTDFTMGYTVALEDVAMIAVELMNTTATQTFTVTRGVDAYAAAHTAGDSVNVAYPARVGL